MKLIKVTDIFKRPTPIDKKTEVYKNGDDNAYPERMDRLINNSVTAKTATNLMIQSLLQKGFGAKDGIIVNKNKQLTFYNFADDCANSKVRQRGFFVWFGWNANYKISDVEVLPFHHCRLIKDDSEGYSSKVHYSKKWDESKQDDLIVFDVFNPDSAVIQAQVDKATSWEKYKGQVLFVNDDTDYIYPLSRIDAVQTDCDTENQIGVYKNVLTRKGFFGKTAVITRPLVDADLPKTIIDVNGNEIRNAEFYQQESDRENFKKTIQDFVGAENAGGALHIELDFEHEDLDKAILFKNIESKIEPDLFEKIESSLRKNILIAFNNIPNGLVEQSEGIFSNSGEAIKEMKKQYDDNCNKERNQLLAVLNMIWKRMEIYDGSEVTLIYSQEVEGAITSVDEKTQDAQAELRGSVGGVTSLLLIQQSVSQKTTSYESGVAMLQNIYGYSEEVARKMLGTVEINPNPTPDAIQ
jgi:hypothetical protein